MDPATNNQSPQAPQPAQAPLPPQSQYTTPMPSYPTPTQSVPTAGLNGPWPGAFAVIGAAFSQIKKNPKPALVIIGAYAILSILEMVVSGGSQVSRAGGSLSASTTQNFEGIGLFLFLLATPIYALAIADRKVISIKEFLVVDAKRYFSIVGAAIAAGLIVGLSALALLVPIIWTLPWFAFITYVIADKRVGPSEALKLSKAVGQHNKGKFWGIVGATILLSLGTFVALFIPVAGTVIYGVAGSFVSLLCSAALATLYRWVQQNQLNDQPATAPASDVSTNYQPPVAPTAPTPPTPPTALVQ